MGSTGCLMINAFEQTRSARWSIALGFVALWHAVLQLVVATVVVVLAAGLSLAALRPSFSRACPASVVLGGAVLGHCGSRPPR